MKKIFLSHSSSDKEFVRIVNRILSTYSIETFLDEKDILVGDSIPDKIYDGLDSSTHLAYVISKSSMQSEWAKEELNIAKMKEKSSKGFKILPILLEDVDLPTSLKHIKYADFRNWQDSKQFKKSISDFLKSLDIHPKTQYAAETLWCVENLEIIDESFVLLTEMVNKIDAGLFSFQAGASADHTLYPFIKLALRNEDIIYVIQKIKDILPYERLESSNIAILRDEMDEILSFLKKNFSSSLQYNNRNNIEIFMRKLNTISFILNKIKSDTFQVLAAAIVFK